MMIDVVVRNVDEIKLLCLLRKVMITFEIIISYVIEKYLTKMSIFINSRLINETKKMR